MVLVRFETAENLASCENFLRFAFPGKVTQDAGGLLLVFDHDAFDPEVEARIVERLLWAWRVSHRVSGEGGVIVESGASSGEAPAT